MAIIISRLAVLAQALTLMQIIGCKESSRPMVYTTIDGIEPHLTKLRAIPSWAGRVATPTTLSPSLPRMQFSIGLPVGARGPLSISVEGLDASGCVVSQDTTQILVQGDWLHNAMLRLSTLSQAGCPDLRVSLSGSGTGRVISTPANIDCGTRCNSIFPISTQVSLRAIPAHDSYFAGWSGGCTGQDACKLTIDARVPSVTARFEQSGPCTPDGFCWENPLPHGFTLHGLWGTDANNVLGVGVGGSIMRYDGTRWRFVKSGTVRTLRTIWGMGASNIYAAGDGGTVLHSTDGGSSFASIVVPTTNALHRIWGRSAQEIYFVGESNKVLRFDGTTWTALPTIGKPTNKDILRSVWSSGPSDVYVAGEIGSFWSIHRFDGRIWKSIAPIDEGLSTPFIGGIYELWGTGPNDVYVAGEQDQSDSGCPWRWDGKKWTQTICEDLMNPEISHLYGRFSLGETAFFASLAGVVRSDGVTSRVLPGPMAETRAIWGSGLDNVHAVGASGRWYHFDGKTVLDRSGVNSRGQINAMQFVAGLGLISVGTYIWLYDGAQWSKMAAQVGDSLNALWANSSNDIYAVGFEGTILHYDGRSWSKQSSGLSGSEFQLTSVWGTLGGDTWISNSDGRMLRRSGATWLMQETIAGVTTAQVIWGRARDDVFASGDGRLFRYDGRAWSEVVGGLPAKTRVNALWGTPDVLYAAGSDNIGGVVLKFDGKIFQVEVRTPYPLLAISGTSASDLYTVGMEGSILHYDGMAWQHSGAGGMRNHAVASHTRLGTFVASDWSILLHRRETP